MASPKHETHVAKSLLHLFCKNPWSTFEQRRLDLFVADETIDSKDAVDKTFLASPQRRLTL